MRHVSKKKFESDPICFAAPTEKDCLCKWVYVQSSQTHDMDLNGDLCPRVTLD